MLTLYVGRRVRIAPGAEVTAGGRQGTIIEIYPADTPKGRLTIVRVDDPDRPWRCAVAESALMSLEGGA